MRHSWKRLAWLGGLYGTLAFAFCAPLFAHPYGLGFGDWDEKLAYYGAVLKSVVEYGQLPFWNPYKCGGGVLWQNPLVPLLAPAYPLAAVMPLGLAMKVEIVLHYFLGFIGMHLLLTEVIGLTFLPLVAYLGSIFTLCGALAIHLEVGHSVFLPAFYLPWLLFFFLRALKSGAVRDALAGGAVLALTIYNAGLHMVSMVVVAVAAIAVTAAVARRSWKPIVLAAVLGISGAVYAAPKLLPVTLYVTSPQFWDTRSPVAHPDLMTAGMVLRSFLDPYQFGHLVVDPAAQKTNWWEYGNYIGLPAALLMLSCVFWIVLKARGRDAWLGWSLALTTVLLLAWTAGEFHALAPASLASHVWFFSRFRIPSRFTIACVLSGAALIGWTLNALEVESVRQARLLIGLVCAFAVMQLLVQNQVLLVNVFGAPPLERGLHPLGGPDVLIVDRSSDAYAPTSPMFRALMNDRAFYNCYESFQLRHSADPDHPLVFTTGDAAIIDVKFTPNRVQFRATGGQKPATVLLNQNYAEGWRSTAGPVQIDKESGKPAVILAPGQSGKFAFYFVAPGVLAGVAIMIAGLMATWFVCRRKN